MIKVKNIIELVGYYLIVFVVILISIGILIKVVDCLIKLFSFLWKKIYECVNKKINLFFKCKKRKEKSISYILKELSKKEQKPIQTARCIKQLSNKDSNDVLNSLKNKELVELFSIRASIEEHFNSFRGVEKDIFKYAGFLFTFIAGIFSSAFSGVYSGIVANLFSDATLNTKKNYDSASDFEKEIAGNINKIGEVITLDDIVTPMFFVGIIILFAIVFLTIANKINMKFNNNDIVLLNVVDYAIEFRKEKEIVKSNESEVTESIKIKDDETIKEIKEIKEIVNKLGSNSLSAKETKELIKGGLDNITYELMQEVILNYHLSQLYNIKANIKNTLSSNKYYDNFQLQLAVVLFSTVVAIKLNSTIPLFLAFLAGMFLRFFIEFKFADKYNVKLILLLEVVENKIENKKRVSR